MATSVQLEERLQTSGALFSSPRARTAVLSLCLMLVTLSVFNPVVHNAFVGFDDPGYVTGNQHVRSGLSWKTVKWASRSTELANWHPLTWLSHALDCQLFGLNAAGHHFVNTLLHGIVAVVLFLALGAMTGSSWRSFVVAALFAVHPMNVQTVAWISERKNLLSSLFFVLALIAYHWYVQRPGSKRYSVVILCFVLGLMSKPMIITLPFVLLLLDYWPLRRASARPGARVRLVLEKLPLFALSAASGAITLMAQRAGGAIRFEHPLSIRLANAVVCYWRYLGKAFWPARLAVFYPYPEHAPSPWEIALAASLLISLTIVVLSAPRCPYLAVGWLWFLGTLVPVIGLVQVGEQVMADRYAYIPFIGLFVAAVWGIADWAALRPIPTSLLVTAAIAVLLVFAIVDRVQIGYWKDNLTLWSHTLAVTEHNYMAEDSLGAELIKEGRLQEAIAHLRAAAAINPGDAFSQLDLGVCEKRLGNFSGAIKDYQTALALSTESSLRATAFGNLGSVYRIQRDYAQARQSYQSALELQPDNLFALIGMGVLSQKTGDLAGAVDYYARAATLEPSDSEYLLLSQALSKQGRNSEARAAYAQAQKLSRNWAATESAVGQVLQD